MVLSISILINITWWRIRWNSKLLKIWWAKRSHCFVEYKTSKWSTRHICDRHAVIDCQPLHCKNIISWNRIFKNVRTVEKVELIRNKTSCGIKVTYVSQHSLKDSDFMKETFLLQLLQSRVTKPLSEGHMSYYKIVRGPDILRTVTVSLYDTFHQINKFFLNISFSHCWKNVLHGRM